MPNPPENSGPSPCPRCIAPVEQQRGDGPVCLGYQHMSTAWTRILFTSSDVRCLPEVPGVYVIQRPGRVVYVGSTVNLRSRAKCHIPVFGGNKPNPPFFSYSVSRRPGDWLMREYRLIQRLLPAENRRNAGYHK